MRTHSVDDRAQPLRGLTVLEFSHTIMGPCAGLLLADLGADVIKIEPGPDGDRTRRLTGFAAGFFATFNRNKRSLCINLKTRDGQAALYRLVEHADIVIENYGPGTMEKLGCDWETLKTHNPRLIYLALKGFLAGPWQNRPALDEVVQFQSGLAYMTGPVGQPLRAGASVVDILGAVFGVTGVLAALRERDQNGRGQRVGSSLFESAVFLMGSHMAGGMTTGEAVPPMTARRGAWGIYDPFVTAPSSDSDSSVEEIDQSQLFIGVTSDQQWERFCEAFALPELAADERLVTNTQRVEQRSWLIPELADRIAVIPYEQVIRMCQCADVSWAPVGRPEDLFDNQQLADGGLLDTSLASAYDSAAASAMLPALPLEFGDHKTRVSLRRQPPERGEHNADVLLEAGLSETEISTLAEKGVITAPKLPV